MATNTWEGDVSGDAALPANWSEGSVPVTNDDVIVPSWATYGITASMDALASARLNSFWVQEGFEKEIGSDTGYFQLDLDGDNGNRFLFEGSSTRAKFHFLKTTENGVIEIRKTGVGNVGQPALQIMTNDITCIKTVIRITG